MFSFFFKSTSCSSVFLPPTSRQTLPARGRGHLHRRLRHQMPEAVHVRVVGEEHPMRSSVPCAGRWRRVFAPICREESKTSFLRAFAHSKSVRKVGRRYDLPWGVGSGRGEGAARVGESQSVSLTTSGWSGHCSSIAREPALPSDRIL